MPPQRPPDAKVRFHLKSQNLEGKIKHVKSGYRPVYDIRSDYWTSTHHEFLHVPAVHTNEVAEAHVWFITPEVYPHTLWIGRTLQVAEGSRVIGSSEVLEVFNPVLKRE